MTGFVSHAWTNRVSPCHPESRLSACGDAQAGLNKIKIPIKSKTFLFHEKEPLSYP